MKQKVIQLLAAFSVCLVFCSCEKSSQTVVGPSPSDTNLLQNSSFESNGIPSLQGWWGWWFIDSSDVQFLQDTPPGGGSWSIKLPSVWGPAPSVGSTIAAPLGTHRYRFSSWAKAIGIGAGSASLLVKSPDTLIIRRTIRIADTTWTSYSVLDTLTTDVGDSLLVVLSGGFSHLLRGYTFYDLCRLEKLE